MELRFFLIYNHFCYMNKDILHETALKAPSSSGVYLWKNSQDDVIYVGKAKNLKNRLTSYFSGKKDIKTRLLVSNAKTIEYIKTSNEYEAFLLENNLIKKYTPKYNINLKDGKSYPVLKITSEDFPRLFKTRNILHDGSEYFGPYPDATALDTFIETLYQIYPLRHCKKFSKKETPCLYYHMGQCKAPCCNKISKESYNEFFGEIRELLNENGDKTEKKLTQKMKEAAANLNFEKAARLRDGLKALLVLQNQNIVESFDYTDHDYIAWYSEGELVSFTILKIRNGKLLGRENYQAQSLSEEEELLSEFISACYTSKEEVPPKLYVPQNTDITCISEWIKKELSSQAQIIPVTEQIENASRHIAAINMAKENAKEDIIHRLRERGDFPALQELKEVLSLKKIPVRIEGFDIAHIGGKFPVASLISFYNGNPDKKNYRYFRLKTTDGYIDDFQSMREAVSRRYTRLLNEQKDLPDLILIDGGIGQVNAVSQVLKSLELDIPIAGLAKRDEEIWRPYAEKPLCLPKRSDALRLLQRVRDETHRFATSRNQTLRTKENTESIFLKINGIGEKKAKLLIKKFTTLENMCNAEESLIAQTLSVRSEKASEILLYARKLLKQSKERKKEQMQSLKESGTTWQKAADAQYLQDLAEKALNTQKEE